MNTLSISTPNKPKNLQDVAGIKVWLCFCSTLKPGGCIEYVPIGRRYKPVTKKPGVITFLDGKMYSASRLSLMLKDKSFDIHNAKIFACHHCDNPPCINPDHLFAGTSKDNMLDMKNKKRGGKSNGINHPQSKLPKKAILWLRKQKYHYNLIGDFARKYNISWQSAKNAYKKVTYKHI